MQDFNCTRDHPGPQDYDEESDSPAIEIRQIMVEGHVLHRCKPLVLTSQRTEDGDFFELEAGEELGMSFIASSVAELKEQILALLEIRWKRYEIEGVRLTPAAQVLKDRMVENYRTD